MKGDIEWLPTKALHHFRCNNFWVPMPAPHDASIGTAAAENVPPQLARPELTAQTVDAPAAAELVSVRQKYLGKQFFRRRAEQSCPRP